MDKITHYINKRLVPYFINDSCAKYRFIILCTAGVHVALLFLFAWLKIPPMIIFNIFSILFYAIAASWIQQDNLLTISSLTYLEIFLHTIFATIYTGDRMGFHLYSIALVSVCFYTSHTMRSMKYRLLYPICYTGIAFAMLLFCKIYSALRLPLCQTIGEQQILLVYIFNLTIAFFVLTFFSLLFILEIRTAHHQVEEKNKQLNILANRDPLTGLYNRRKMHQYLMEAEQSGRPFTIVLCDIDDFKKVNDTYGHDCGDRVLIHVSNIFLREITSPHRVCRWGGEEILLLLYTDLSDSVRIAERCRLLIGRKKILYDNQEVAITLTFGLCSHHPAYTLDDMILHADRNLYLGKTGGKNQVVS